MNKHIDNSTTISGGTVSGNQFAAGSKSFRGTINNISQDEKENINQLTEKLIEALNAEADKIDDVEEIKDAINQAHEASTKEKVNKLTLSGVLSGIKMVMTDIKGISTTTQQLYSDWHEAIFALIN